MSLIPQLFWVVDTQKLRRSFGYERNSFFSIGCKIEVIPKTLQSLAGAQSLFTHVGVRSRLPLPSSGQSNVDKRDRIYLRKVLPMNLKSLYTDALEKVATFWRQHNECTIRRFESSI